MRFGSLLDSKVLSVSNTCCNVRANNETKVTSRAQLATYVLPSRLRQRLHSPRLGLRRPNFGTISSVLFQTIDTILNDERRTQSKLESADSKGKAAHLSKTNGKFSMRFCKGDRRISLCEVEPSGCANAADSISQYCASK